MLEINKFKLLFPGKKSSIHYIAFSSEKVISSGIREKYAQIKQCLHAKTVLNKYVGGF